MKLRLLLSIAMLAVLAAPTPGRADGSNGSAGDMPAYYDGNLFQINFKQQSDGAAASLIANNKSINVIYMSDAGLGGNVPFVSVLDAIQGDGFNPLWVEAQINFNSGFPPTPAARSP